MNVREEKRGMFAQQTMARQFNSYNNTESQKSSVHQTNVWLYS